MKQPQKIGIYIHIPFCVKKCGYCDFLSFPATEASKERYIKALCQEIGAGIPDFREKNSHVGDLLISTIFFGGGTPSLLSGEQIGQILKQIRQTYPVAEDAELTMEANPGTLTAESLKAYRRAGINRLSIGLQSAQNKELQALGRIHTWEDFLENLQVARRAGFENLNIDLMSALPGQTLASWEDTLQKVLECRPEHISAYSLILEEGTPFYELYGGEQGSSFLPDEETERRMYEVTEEYFRQAGFYRYEISNYARSGFECRHNCSYWKRIPYWGVGLGASSFWKEIRWKNQSNLTEYLRAWEIGDWEKPQTTEAREREAWQEIESLSVSDQMAETMFLGLRMMEGIEEAGFYKTFGQSLDQVYGTVLKKQERLGLIERKNGRVRLTQYGIDVSNQVFCDFL